MNKQSSVGAYAMVTIGSVLALIALFGIVRTAVVAADPYGDAASTGGGIVGILVWGGLAALLLTMGIRKLRAIKRRDASR
jgi:hypothetical protein